MSEEFSKLRAMLTQRGTSERWWQAVELVLGAEEESILLQEYLVAHVSRDESWRGCRVPCGDWGPEHSGHGLCEVQTRGISGLPDATEIHCPPGTFRMGASPEDKQSGEYEKPAREVTLTRGFWALSTPVTQAMYEAVTRENPSRFKGAKRPVEQVTWVDAARFCNQLSELAGLTQAYHFQGEEEVEWLQEADGVRLPTEAEWEYLCRAGSTTTRYGALNQIAWQWNNSRGKTHPVGEKEPNAWGLFDTLGSVWEWCLDQFDEYAYRNLPQTDPAHVPNKLEKCVQRGGGWGVIAEYARASGRNWGDANFADSGNGFRCVRTHLVNTKP